jgi:hypothetical protein
LSRCADLLAVSMRVGGEIVGDQVGTDLQILTDGIAVLPSSVSFERLVASKYALSVVWEEDVGVFDVRL